MKLVEPEPPERPIPTKADLRGMLDRLRAKAAAAPQRESTRPAPKCSTCRDARWVILPVDGIEAARKCPACLPTTEQILARAGVPEEFWRASFTEDVHPQNTEHSAALDQLVTERFQVDGRVRSVYLFGGFGTGKSHFAGALAVAVVERFGWSIAWVSIRDLLRDLQAIYQSQQREDGGESEAAILRRLHQVELLVLDELPRGKARQDGGQQQLVSPWVAEQVEGIVDHRTSRHKPIVLTGNIETDEIASRYNGALASRLGPRFFEWVRFDGEDLRRIG